MRFIHTSTAYLGLTLTNVFIFHASCIPTGACAPGCDNAPPAVRRDNAPDGARSASLGLYTCRYRRQPRTVNQTATMKKHAMIAMKIQNHQLRPTETEDGRVRV